MLPGCVMGGVLFHLRTREKRCESEERIDYARRAVCVCKCVCVCGGDSYGVIGVKIWIFCSLRTLLTQGT